MLISFEGIDGCGKSTQIELLKNYFSEKKIDYHIFREPGGTELSEEIRSLLLHSSGDMNPVTELLLFSAARSQLIREKVMPLLKDDKTVILDRFYDSTTAYQGYGRGSLSLREIESINKIASHSVTPDLTFYLKIDPEVASRRTNDLTKDRMEVSGLEFFKKVSSGYDELVKMENRIKVIDASKTPEEIHGEILDVFNSHQ